MLTCGCSNLPQSSSCPSPPTLFPWALLTKFGCEGTTFLQLRSRVQAVFLSHPINSRRPEEEERVARGINELQHPLILPFQLLAYFWSLLIQWQFQYLPHNFFTTSTSVSWFFVRVASTWSTHKTPSLLTASLLKSFNYPSLWPAPPGHSSLTWIPPPTQFFTLVETFTPYTLPLFSYPSSPISASFL